EAEAGRAPPPGIRSAGGPAICIPGSRRSSRTWRCRKRPRQNPLMGARPLRRIACRTPARCIAALIAVMDHVARPTLTDGGFERVDNKLSPQVIGHRPADDLAAPGIKNDGEIEEPARRRHEGD